jgi:hypothetical protein
MKYLTLTFLVVLFISTAYTQVSLRAGMGVDYISAPSLYNYFNQNFSDPGSQVGSFRASVNFSGEADYKLSNKYELGLDLTYRIYSYNFNGSLGSYNLSSHNIMPTIVNYYVIKGDGYEFKFGGGPGIRFLNADEHLPGTTTTQTYTSVGIGFLLRAAGNTKISSELFASILFDIRYDLNGEPKYNGNNLYNAVDNSNVNFNSLSIGVGLGLTYYL